MGPEGYVGTSAKNWAFGLLFPSFVPALAVFMTVLLVVSVVRRKSPTSSAATISRILIAGAFFVILWLGGIYMFRWMLDSHAYVRIALSGAFVVALLVWFFWPDRSNVK
jgi:hypothetical protein